MVARGERTEWVLVLGLTALAFVLRARGITQSLALDEDYTFQDVQARSLGSLFSELRKVHEVTPPLFFILAWFSYRLGNHAIWIRVPSLILGTGAVPLIYLVGRRTVGSRAGVIAAALLAVSPFAIFFGTEARAYATLIFLSALSTLVLFRALGRRSPSWWVAYAISALAVAYTHYTGAVVLVAQAMWGIWEHRDQWRAILSSNGLVALACLPWYASEARPVGLDALGGPLHPRFSTLANLVALFPGQPYSQVFRPALSELPGRVPLIMVGGGLLLALGARALPHGPPGAVRLARARSTVWLMGLLGVSSPLAMFVYSLNNHDIFLSRYFSASLPAILLLVGWLLASLPFRSALPSLGLVLSGTLVGTIKELGPSYARPRLDAAASFILKETRPGDPVVDYAGFLTAPLSIYLRGERTTYPSLNDPTPWLASTRGHRIALVAPSPQSSFFFGGVNTAMPPSRCFHRVAYRRLGASHPPALGPIPPIVVIYDFPAVCAYYGAGFSLPEHRGALRWRWSVRPTADIAIVNPFRSPRQVTISGSLLAPPSRHLTAVLSYPHDIVEHVRVGGAPIKFTRRLLVPSGATAIKLISAASPLRDPRPLYLQVVNLSAMASRRQIATPIQ